jgi:hypothetical protein
LTWGGGWGRLTTEAPLSDNLRALVILGAFVAGVGVQSCRQDASNVPVLAAAPLATYEVHFSSKDGRFCGVPTRYSWLGGTPAALEEGYADFADSYRRRTVDAVNSPKQPNEMAAIALTLERTNAEECCTEVGARHVGWRADGDMNKSGPFVALEEDFTFNQIYPSGSYVLYPICLTT